jgi:FAD:protein FMN transferase
MLLRRSLLVFAPTVSLWLLACAASPNSFESTRWVMGTALRVVVSDQDEARAQRRLDQLFASASQWEQWLSHYRDDSLLSELHRRAGERVATPPQVRAYFERSRRDQELTDGRFDILHASRIEGNAWEGVTTSAVGDSTWVQLSPGVVVDPGGNGKGIAVQAMVDSLRGWHVSRALIDFGGSSWYALASPERGDLWSVDVVDGQGAIVGTARWKDAALSISQTQLRGEDPGLDAHIVDPADDTLITEDRIAIVLSKDSTDAEVLSTTLIVGGVDALEVVQRYDGASAVLIVGGQIHRSDRAEWFEEQPRRSRPPATRRRSPEAPVTGSAYDR